jgi:hypothetical protein
MEFIDAPNPADDVKVVDAKGSKCFYRTELDGDSCEETFLLDPHLGLDPDLFGRGFRCLSARFPPDHDSSPSSTQPRHETGRAASESGEPSASIATHGGSR